MALTGVILGWLGVVIGIPGMILSIYMKSYVDETLQDPKVQEQLQEYREKKFEEQLQEYRSRQP